jgi:DNA gyrase/topoisomerase IV subunit A
VKTIKGKKLCELYTPAGANQDGFTDRDTFEQVVGNADFHSFQVWRSSAKRKATCTYALTLEQVSDICRTRDRKASALKGQITKLAKENAQLRQLQQELEHLAQNNQQLQTTLADAAKKAKEATELAAVLQHNVDILAERVPEERMTRQHASPTGKSAAQLVVEAPATEFKGAISIQMGGKPYRDRYTITRYRAANLTSKTR